MIHLTGVDNFRDFGGFACGDGARIRTGRLFRSAHLARATDSDLSALKAFGLEAIVDLRRPSEREAHPSRRWPGSSSRVLASEEGDRAESPHIAFLRRGDHSDGETEAFLIDYYRQAPFDPRHLDLFAQTFAALEQSEGAILIHCMAGKDRTGVLVALIQRALGAGDEVVRREFMATNQAMLTPERVAAATPWLRSILSADPTAAILHGFLGVHTHHLDAAFSAIDARAGSLHTYLAELGFDEQRLAGIRRRLLA